MGRALRAAVLVATFVLATFAWPAPAVAASPAAAPHPSHGHIPSAKLRALSAVTPGGTWSWQNPSPNGNALDTITCPTALVCFAAGDNGPVLTTTDGGSHWSRQQNETGVLSLSCGDASFCVGVTLNAGEIQTSNGGATWTSGPTGFGQLYGVSCGPGTHTCLGVGDGGMIAELTGNAIGQQSSGTTNVLFGISCTSPTLICAAVGYNGTILSTAGGGWAAMQTATSSFLLTVSCGATQCVAGGTGGTVFTWPVGSTNAASQSATGSTANVFGSSCPQSMCMVSATDGLIYMGHGNAWGPQDIGAPGAVWSITCPSVSFCLAAGDGTFIAATTNGGTGWQLFTPPEAHGQFDSVSCPTSSMCFAVGFGVAKRTTDGGATWVDLGVATNIRAISCPSTTVCYLVGSKSDNTGALVYKTADGGTTWTNQLLGTQPNKPLNAVSCPGVTTCYAGGDNDELFATTDGSTWKSELPALNVYNTTAISCPTLTNCLAIAYAGQMGVMLASTDGTTWAPRSTPVFSGNAPLYAIKCPSTTTCYAVGRDANVNYTIFKTVDGGATWTQQSKVGSYPDPLDGIDCLSTTNCFTVGHSGDIYETTDGNNWTAETAPYGIWYGVSCATSTTTWCYAVDFFGTIVRTNNGGAMWLRVFPNATHNDLKSISCPSTTVCFAVDRDQGNPGHGHAEVQSSTDGGSTWRSLFTEMGALTDPLLAHIACPTASVCFATDSLTSIGGQLVLKSIDGGATWSSVQVGTSSALSGIACPDTTNCFVADAAGYFTRTADGGATWSTRALITAGGSSAISCPTTSTCYAADVAKPGHIYKTSNVGASWSLTFDLAADLSGGSQGSFDAISCSNSNVCTAVGTAGLAATTTDGGVNWRTDNVELAANLTAVSCPTDDTCFAATDDAAILRSTDWGGDWLAAFAGVWFDTRSQFAGLSCPTTTGCFAVGFSGLIASTISGGAAWTKEQPVGQVTTINSISCTDSSNCYAAAFGFIGPSGIQVTHDGGATWTYHTVNKADSVGAVSCPATNTCFAAGWPGAIYFSGDGGTTWTYQNNPFSGADETLIGLSCPSTTTCYAVGTGGHILNTTNGGTTWTLMASGTTQFLGGVSCASTTSCVAVGANGTTVSLSGTTWQVHGSGTTKTLSAVSCPTTTRCYAVGASGTMLATSDHGATWTAETSGVTDALHGIQCTSSTGCLAGGNFGSVIYTLDGATWASTPVPTSNQIRGVAFLNPGVAWLVGVDGTILQNPNLFFLCLTTVVSSDKASPQAIGTTVTFTASSPGGCNHVVQFLVLPPGGSWTIVQTYSSAATWSWNTTGLGAGTYWIEALSRDAGSPGVAGTPPNAFDSSAAIPFTLKVMPCTGVSLSTAPASPIDGGPVVLLTASASGCLHPLYQFWILPSGSQWQIVQPYSSSATFNWNTSGLPAGNYTYTVWARDSGSTGTFCSSLGCNDLYYPATTYTLTTLPCTSVSDSAAPGSPQPSSTSVTFTASSTGCPNPLYQFWILRPGSQWQIVQPYSSSATLIWNTTGLPAGNYSYTVWARDSASTGTFCSSLGCNDKYFPATTYTLTTQACASVGDSTAPGSPQGSGTSVTFTASSSGCTNPLYQFWILRPGSTWQIVQPYSSSATFNWTTTGLPAGTYTYTVWVRDASSSGTFCSSLGCNDKYYPATTYSLTTQPCTSVSDSPTPGSPQASGTSVTFTASASGCLHPLYQFWILRPGSQWQIVQPYSTTATFTWTTTGLPPGSYTYTVWARDSGSTGTFCSSLGCNDAYSPATGFSVT